MWAAPPWCDAAGRASHRSVWAERPPRYDPRVGLRLTVVDAFTDVPFTGNPAAVAIVDRFPEDDRMQAVASELQLSETAFVVPRGDGEFDLRWFTPTVEVDLCGHATIAAADLLGGSVGFRTRSGPLVCTASGGGWIELALPADPPTEAPLPAGLAGSDVRWFGRGREDALVELCDPEAVRSFEPDHRTLSTLAPRGVAVTATGDGHGADFVSRFFAPNAGIPEDPVTGSVHAMLAVHWSNRTGRDRFTAAQLSPRGGRLSVRLAGPMVHVGGQAVTTAQVTLVV